MKKALITLGLALAVLTVATFVGIRRLSALPC
jgi:hypothetical protein